MSGSVGIRCRTSILSALAALVLLTGCADASGAGETPTWSDGAEMTAGAPAVEPVDGLGPAESATPSRPSTPPSQPSASATGTAAPTQPGRTVPSSPSAQPTRPARTPSGPWSTTVDNTTAGRFSASSSWRQSTNSTQKYGADYHYANPVESSDVAWYKVPIPQTATYRVEVRFPAKSSFNDRTPYVVVTANGNRTIHVNQQTNGGRWVSLGTFTLTAGDEHKVGVSRWRTAGTGYVIADAIRVTRV